MKCLSKRAGIVFRVMMFHAVAIGTTSIAILGCAQIIHAKPEPIRTVSVGGDNPFGGTPAVEIPSDARAMSAFLKA